MSKFIEMFDETSEKQIHEAISKEAEVEVKTVERDGISNISSETVRPTSQQIHILPFQQQQDLNESLYRTKEDDGSLQFDDDGMSRLRFIGISIAVFLSLFIFALDQCVMASTLPAVADHFNALDQMVWLVNSLFLTLIGFSLAYIQCCHFVPAKHSTMFAIAIFELGILISSVAINFEMLLAGRVISGLGGAGLYNGGMMIITETFSLKRRVKAFGIMGTSFGVAAAIGPAVAGTLTQKLSWRWCFWINLPCGVLSLMMIGFLTKTRPPLGFEAMFTGYDLTMVDRLLHCDWLGVAFILAWGATVIVSMADGGRMLHWIHPVQVFLLVMVGILPILFAVWEWYMGKHALIQVSIFKRKSMRSAVLVGICTFASSAPVLYFLSTMLKALYNISGTIGGLLILPLIIGQTISLLLSGEIIVRTGYAWPLLVLGPFLTTISSFILSTTKPTTSLSLIIGLSCLAGVGTGLVSQTVMLIAQMQYKRDPNMLGSATGVTLWANNVGRFLGAAIGSCIFGNVIQYNLTIQAPDLDPGLRFIVQHNAQSIWTKLPVLIRPAILQAYRLSLDDVFIASACFGGLGILCSLLSEWTRV